MSFAERNICETVLSFLCLLVLLITIFQRKCNNTKNFAIASHTTPASLKKTIMLAQALPHRNYKSLVSGLILQPLSPRSYHLIKAFNTIRDLFIFQIIKDENLYHFKSTKKKSLIGIFQLTFLKKPAY